MENLKAAVSIALSVMLVVSLYVGGALLGYFLAALSIAFVLLLIISALTTGFYLVIRSIFGTKKEKPLI